MTRSAMPSYEEYIEAIKPLWDTHWLTNMGQYHRELETRIKEYLQTPFVSLMVNGHMALEMAIQMMGFKKGGEVITTPFTFVSTTHAIVRNGLVPVFCDIKAEDGTIDENKIEKLITDKTVAIVPVHVYGNVCNVERIQEIADKYGLKVIYDAAHAFGESYKGKPITDFGDASVFSFHATKVFNTIEGGAVAFKNKDYYDRLYNLKNFGIRGEESVVDVGANAKMNEFCAVMGLCNLKHVDNNITERKARYNKYMECLSEVKGIRSLLNMDNCKKNYSYFPVLIEKEYGLSRDEVYDLLANNNIYARKYFYPLTSDTECYIEEGKKYELPVSRYMSSNVLTLPFWHDMDIELIEKISFILKKNKR